MASLATPYNYTQPDWAPLERAVRLAELPPATCGAFMWMQEEPMGVHHYKNRDTRRYARLTADTPEPGCVAQLRRALSMEVAHG